MMETHPVGITTHLSRIDSSTNGGNLVILEFKIIPKKMYSRRLRVDMGGPQLIGLCMSMNLSHKFCKKKILTNILHHKTLKLFRITPIIFMDKKFLRK
jgi:hypothetical protein